MGIGVARSAMVRAALGVALLCGGPAGQAAQPAGGTAAGAAAAAPQRLTPAKLQSIVERWGKNLVPVQFWLQKSEGEEPTSEFTGSERSEQRPLEIAALAVDPETLWLPDLNLEPRFIARVACGRTAARLHGRFLHAAGWIVRTEAPLAGVDRLEFVPPAELAPVERLAGIKLNFEDGGWSFVAVPLLNKLMIRGGEIEAEVEAGTFIMDVEKGPAGYAFGDALSIKDGPWLWRGADVAADAVLTFDALDKLAVLFARNAGDQIPTVRVFLKREEDEDEGGSRLASFLRRRYSDSDRNDLLVSGIAVGPRHVLVNHSLDRENAMRLDRVVVVAGGAERPAKFLGALKDYGAFLAEVEGEPLPAFLDCSGQTSFPVGQPLVAVCADHESGKRRDRVEFNRIARLIKGYRNAIEPALARFPRIGTVLYGAEDQRLLGVVIEIDRDEDGDEGRFAYARRSYSPRYRSGTIDLRVITVQELRGIIEKTPQGFDPRLRPLPTERQRDLVWFGVEFQQIDRDLARSKGIEIATRGGEVGMMVLHVYPGSPAAKAGIAPGDILLSVKDPDKPEPFEFSQRDGSYSARELFDGLPEELPEEVEDEVLGQMPAPWRSQENGLNLKLTEIGEGKDVDFRYLRGTEERTLRLTLEIGPPSFENAPKEKLESIGLTVKDLTFEVRSHYRLAADAPGVVVARIESGSPAAVAKMRPFDIAASVNGEPVTSAKDFRAKVESFLGKRAPGERKDLELKLERLGKSRIVKIRA